MATTTRQRTQFHIPGMTPRTPTRRPRSSKAALRRAVPEYIAGAVRRPRRRAQVRVRVARATAGTAPNSPPSTAPEPGANTASSPTTSSRSAPSQHATNTPAATPSSSPWAWRGSRGAERRGPTAPRSGVQSGLRDPSVSADVPLNECGQPVFDAGNRSRAVLMVLFVAQQRGQCGGVGELLHRRSDFADGEVVVIVDG